MSLLIIMIILVAISTIGFIHGSELSESYEKLLKDSEEEK